MNEEQEKVCINNVEHKENNRKNYTRKFVNARWISEVHGASSKQSGSRVLLVIMSSFDRLVLFVIVGILDVGLAWLLVVVPFSHFITRRTLVFIMWPTRLEEAHRGVLNQRQEYHQEGHEQINIDRLDVRYFGQWGVGVGGERGHGQHCGHSQTNSRMIVFAIQPKWNPAYDDNQESRHVHLIQIESKRPSKVELTHQSGPCSRGKRFHVLVLWVSSHRECGQKDEIAEYERFLSWLPIVEKIGSWVSICKKQDQL